MLRRSLATLILTFSLIIASVAWSGFLALRTVLDVDRSQRVAESLYDDQTVRDQLAANIGAAVGATVPDGAAVSQEQIDRAAKTALDSPAVKTLIVNAFVATHRAFLGDGRAPDSLDAGAFGLAARDALVAQQPSLDAVLPASPAFEVPLPTERVPNLGFVRDLLERFVPILALVAAGGALFALVSTSDRPAVLRRAGFWAIGVSAFVLLFAFGIPWAGERFAPDQSAVIAALVGALAATTKGPALAMAASGLAGILGAFLWNRAPARVADRGVSYAPAIAPPTMPSEPPRPRRGGRAVRRDMPTGPSATRFAPPVAPPVAAPPPPPAAPPPPRPAPPAPPAPPGQTVYPPPGGAAADPLDPRWVEGHGWVLDPASPDIPADARWVPGVGYVTDRSPHS